ncbi:L,D-transpeptidase family protein [Candidatus Parcubacteria bacterium]|nr:L,D-transpeptidase family protein [Candidatus Parcubacteria bacterium]
MPGNEIFVEKKNNQTASVADTIKEREEELRQLRDFETEKKQEFISQKTDFLEIHLQEMKARIYKQGILEKEISILAKGDPEFWGGVPSGLYQVISGYKKAFSNIAKVYMPWSINFYAKYYLHGEPFYSNGQPTEFDYTGGCVRFSDEDAEFIYNATEIEMPVLIIDKENNGYKYDSWKKTKSIPELSAQSWLIADLDNDYVLAEKNPEEILPIASLTKLMAAVVVIENNDLRKSIWVNKEMLNAYGSTPGLEAGQKYNLVELLHPLLIQSSNDAAEILTYFSGREKTIRLMNEKTKMIGMENTFYEDPSGLSEKNVSTVKDLFYLGNYIFNTRPLLLKISKGEIIETFSSVCFQDLHNKNIFPESQDFLGGKTGFILESKYTGMFLFELPLPDNTSHNIIIVLLKSDDLKDDVQKILFWWLEENYLE